MRGRRTRVVHQYTSQQRDGGGAIAGSQRHRCLAPQPSQLEDTRARFAVLCLQALEHLHLRGAFVGVSHSDESRGVHVSRFAVSWIALQGSPGHVGGVGVASLSKMQLPERRIRLDVGRVDHQRDLEFGLRPHVVALLEVDASEIAVSLVIVRDEIDSRHECLDRCVEILIFLLQRPNHPVEGVRAQQWFQRERRVELADGVGTLSLTLICQPEQVSCASGRGQRAERLDQRLLGLVESLGVHERVRDGQARTLVIRVEPDCVAQPADAARGLAVRKVHHPEDAMRLGAIGRLRKCGLELLPRVVNEAASECGRGTRERIAVARAPERRQRIAPR